MPETLMPRQHFEKCKTKHLVLGSTEEKAAWAIPTVCHIPWLMTGPLLVTRPIPLYFICNSSRPLRKPKTIHVLSRWPPAKKSIPSGSKVLKSNSATSLTIWVLRNKSELCSVSRGVWGKGFQEKTARECQSALWSSLHMLPNGQGLHPSLSLFELKSSRPEANAHVPPEALLR